MMTIVTEPHDDLCALVCEYKLRIRESEIKKKLVITKQNGCRFNRIEICSLVATLCVKHIVPSDTENQHVCHRKQNSY